MKTCKSPATTEVTPSKKKLKQARLPFKIISEGASCPTTPTSRKRKLSAADVETVPKIGKVSKENDLTEDLVVISDEETNEKETESHNQDKVLNPYVKLVDNVWKKKMQKSAKKKEHRKKRTSKGKSSPNKSTEINSRDSDIIMLEVDDKTDHLTEGSDEKLNSDSKVGNDNQTMILDSTEKCSESYLENSNHIPDNIIEINTNLKSKSQSDNELQGEKITVDKVGKELKENKQPDKKKESIPEVTTPKRSERIKANDEKCLSSTPSSASGEKVTTPLHNRSSSVTNSLDDSMSEGNKSANLTPKQLQKKIESAKKKEEREKERLERDKKKQEEKEERVRQKQEREDQKRKEREEKEEAKRKEKEEKEELRKKEKEEKEKQKELERKQREEKEEMKRKEKEDKDEQKRKEKEAKEEEKRKKQEALEQEKIEQELKMKKAKEAFVNFFVQKQKIDTDQASTSTAPVSKSSMLSSFAIKTDMRLAPTVRKNLSEERKKLLEEFLSNQSTDVLYLQNLKNDGIQFMKSGKTWPLDDKDNDDDVVIVEDELPPVDSLGEIMTCDATVCEKLRPKLLSFHQNRRPPYWGTWRKKSTFVKPRRPFGQDEKQLDYDVDSDEEWEEEPEGESINGSVAGSDDEQDSDEYEVDNEVFVPHGYLSDEEATMEEEDDMLSLSPETQKARLKYLEDEFEFELKKPTEKLKPRLYGPLWETSDGGKPEKCVDAIWNYFGKLAMILEDTAPLLQPSSEPEEQDKKKTTKKKKNPTEGEEQSPKSDKKKKGKTDNKEGKKSKPENKIVDVKKINQPPINSFLSKLKQT